MVLNSLSTRVFLKAINQEVKGGTIALEFWGYLTKVVDTAYSFHEHAHAQPPPVVVLRRAMALGPALLVARQEPHTQGKLKNITGKGKIGSLHC